MLLASAPHRDDDGTTAHQVSLPITQTWSSLLRRSFRPTRGNGYNGLRVRAFGAPPGSARLAVPLGDLRAEFLHLLRGESAHDGMYIRHVGLGSVQKGEVVVGGRDGVDLRGVSEEVVRLAVQDAAEFLQVPKADGTGLPIGEAVGRVVGEPVRCEKSVGLRDGLDLHDAAQVQSDHGA